jgi:heat shock protein HslJ
MRTIYLQQVENERPGPDMRKVATAIAICFLLIGCETTKNPMNSAPSQPAVNLAGTQWTLEEIDGKPVIENSKATLAFLQAGRVSGNGSCNRFMGPAEISGNQIKMGPLAGTKMMCEAAPSEQESTYLKALEGAQRFAIQDGKLLVYVAGSDMVLRFHAATTAENK